MKIGARELREERRKQIANKRTQGYDNLFTGVRFYNKTYVFIEEFHRTGLFQPFLTQIITRI
jgi:hypothetical protein